MISWMLKLPLRTRLAILAALLACGGQTPVPGKAEATVPDPRVRRNFGGQ
jgi:hypothetical protein